ncbi:MAG: hypothetical protein LAN62_13300, partial [Acidobacteriia bacterium]|nr:hypothetical protein [Terriglobia bacterium]
MVKRRQAYAARAKSGGRLGSLTVMALLAVISLGTRAPGATADGPVPDSRVVHSSARAAHLYAQLPMSFEPNRGQTDQRVKFLARGQGYTLFLTPHEAVLTLHPNAPSGE